GSFKWQTEAVFRCGGDLGTGRLFSQWTAINTVTPQTTPRWEKGAPIILSGLHSTQQIPGFGGDMGFSAIDWVALFIFGVSALVGTFGKRLVRIIGLAVMPFTFAGLILSLSHHGSAPGQRPITNNAPSISTNNTKNTKNTNNTNNQSGGTDILDIVG